MRTDDRTTSLGGASGVQRALGVVEDASAIPSDANVVNRRTSARKASQSSSRIVENDVQASSVGAASFLTGVDHDTLADQAFDRGMRRLDTPAANDRSMPARNPRGSDVPGGRWPLACLVLLLSACAQQPPAKPRPAGPPINLSGYSPAFRQGFQEGCDTARGDRRRNEQRYTQDVQYARGWDDGRAICGKR